MYTFHSGVDIAMVKEIPNHVYLFPIVLSF